MANLIVDFEWPVAKSYTYEPPGPPGRALAGGAGMTRSGRKIVVARFGSLVAKGPTELERPLDQAGALLRILLLPMSLRKKALMAAESFGMLTCGSRNGQSEPLSTWKLLVDDLKELERIQASGVARHGISLGARFDVLLLPATGREGLRLAFRPVNLREAIKIFWATTIVSGGTLRPCEQCGEYFEAGGKRGVRSDRKYCSEGCHNRFNNARKRNRKE
jgi:hypothetical protein